MGVALGSEQLLASNVRSQGCSGACISWPLEKLGFGNFFGPKMQFFDFDSLFWRAEPQKFLSKFLLKIVDR